jgi:hypothetical protein
MPRPATYPVLLAASLTAALALTACGSAPAPRACNLERLELKDMDRGSVNGAAMGTYAIALADSGTTGPLASPVQKAVTDANSARSDAASGNFGQYETDAGAFIADLEVIHGDCAHGIR